MRGELKAAGAAAVGTEAAKTDAAGNAAVPDRSKPGFQWTEAKREAFLGRLAESCNVKASCLAVGMQTSSLYKLRRDDDGFAAQWRAALLAGYDRLEEQLLQAAGAGEDVEPGFDPELAMRLLDRHRRARDKEAGGDRSGPVTRATRAEAEAALHAKLDAMERGRKRRSRK